MTSIEEPDLIDALMAIRPAQTDVFACSLRAWVRHAVVGADDQPFRLGRFTVLGPLGGGGMGTVFLAYDPDLDRKIALKVLHTRGDRGLREVLREGRALARLSHPAVVTVHEVGVLADQVFVVMEYVEGGDLRVWLREPRSSAAILDILLEAGSGLAAAHDAGLVHLDFKPANVLVDAAGHARVIDFGLARPLLDTGAASPVSGFSPASFPGAGTPGYMAPERREGALGDPRADQYSFCVTAWEALLGQRPQGGQELPPERPGVSSRVLAALRRGMRSNPGERFATMHELLAALAPRPARGLRVLAALLLVGLVLGAYQFGQRSTPAPRCLSPWAQIAGTWNDDRADALAAAFITAAVPFARETWATVRPALDRYAAAWIAAHARACEDAGVRAILPAPLLEQRLACLEDHRLHLAALVDRFAAADAATITNAVTAVERLPPIDACDRAAPTDLIVTSDPALVARRRVVRGSLARARAELDTGRAAAAAPLLEEALTRAREVDSPALLAEVLVVAGNSDRLASRFDRGLERAREALTTAVAHAEPLQAGWAALLLAQLHNAQGDAARNDELLALADAFTRQAGEPTPLRMSVLLTRGTVALEAAPTPVACDELSRARDYALQHDQRRAAAVSLGNLGKCRDMLGEYAVAVDLITRSIAELEPLVGALHPWLASLHINLGGVLTELAEYDAALRHFDRARAIAAANFPGDHVLLAAARMNASIVHNRRRRWADALVEQRAALAIDERLLGPDHPTVALVLCNMGTPLRNLHHLDEALARTTRATAIQSAALPPEHCDVMACNDIHGGILHELGRGDEARTILEATHARFVAVACPPDQRASLELQLAQTLWATAGAAERARVLALLDAAEPHIAADVTRDELVRLRAAVR